MLRLTGSVILIVSAWFASAGLIRDHKAGLRELEALYDMISCIRDNIEHLMKPLPDIFQTYANEYLENCGFLPNVRQTDLRQAWDGQTFTLSGEAYILIRDFVHAIGSGYRAEELRLCEYTLGRLRTLLDRSRSDAANKLKLYRTVPMMFALSVILILL